jgi:hypothetical protein
MVLGIYGGLGIESLVDGGPAADGREADDARR